MSLRATGIYHSYEGSYGRVKALDGINITFEKGEVVLLSGRNGSGKSTLLHVLSGVLKPASGSVSAGGGTTAMAIQYPERALFEKTIFDDIAFGLKNAGKKGEELRTAVMDAAGSLGIPDEAMSMDPRILSHGQKRLAALAGVFAMKPSYLLLDEPFAGLDLIGRKAVMNAIITAAGRGSATVIASHDIGIMLGICTRIVVVDGGRIIMDCDPESLKSPKLELPGIAMPDVVLLARSLEAKGVDTRGAWSPEELAIRAFNHVKGDGAR